MRLPSSQYRGVIRQQSGKWGAQLCKKDEQIWLGTFCTEVAAAEAYDISAQSLRGCHAKTNFKLLSQSNSNSRTELLFLQSRTQTEIIHMIRNCTYHAEFRRSLHDDELIQQKRLHDSGKLARKKPNPNCEFLFHKVVSPDDLRPQKRLLIPRELAMQHFSSGVSSVDAAGDDPKGYIMDFEDEVGKIWRFQYYPFWRGNRNHTLTRGWANFVKEKGIKQGDVIKFWRVTDELDAAHLLIIAHANRRTAMTATPTTPMHVLKPLHNNKILRLFGVDIPVDECN